MKFLHKFTNVAEYDTVKDNLEKPGVSYAKAENKVFYDPYFDPANGYEYVDLGLSVKWATCNLGATKPEEYGDYYMWGSVTPNTNDVCTWKYTPYQTKASAVEGYETKWTKYLGSKSLGYKDPSATDEDVLKTVLDPEDDAAVQNLGGKWRMATRKEFNELLSGTTNTWTTENGVYGRKFTSKTDSSKYIFIPASGRRNGSSFEYQDTYGLYGLGWSSSFSDTEAARALNLYFTSSFCAMSDYYRCNGQTIRPVLAV